MLSLPVDVNQQRAEFLQQSDIDRPPIDARHIAPIDEECEVGEFMAVRGDPITGAVIRNGRIQLNDEPGWGMGLDPALAKKMA